MPPSGPPTLQEIWKIARRTTHIIESNITSNVCLFGSAASSLWAHITHVPHRTKETIVGADERYYLERSRKRGATHQILYCRLPGWSIDETRRVKVDILVPPVLNIPTITRSETYLIKNIPVMPIFDLLVTKTQGWRDHHDSYRADFRAKESADVSDIFALLERAKRENVSYIDEANEDRHSQAFMSHAQALANRFVHVYGRPQQWRVLGFPV